MDREQAKRLINKTEPATDAEILELRGYLKNDPQLVIEAPFGRWIGINRDRIEKLLGDDHTAV